MRILGLCGSVSLRSSNRSLLELLSDLAPDTMEVEIFPALSVLPFYEPDLDQQGVELPRSVAQFRSEVAQASALVLATPEYAHGVPGVLKNALDWLVSGPEMLAKPVGLIFGSASDAGYARAALIEILTTMSAQVVPGAVLSVQASRVQVSGPSREVTEGLQGVLAALTLQPIALGSHNC